MKKTHAATNLKMPAPIAFQVNESAAVIPIRASVGAHRIQTAITAITVTWIPVDVKLAVEKMVVDVQKDGYVIPKLDCA